jgi:hypothetical protein
VFAGRARCEPGLGAIRVYVYVEAVPLQPFTGAESGRFTELSELYAACRSALRGVTEETQSRPAPNSPAALDMQALVGREPPIAATAEVLIVGIVQLYLYAASEHLGGLASLYAAGEVLVSPLVLSRCAVEYSAHVLWILGDPTEESEDRLARAFLEEIFGAEQSKMQAGRLFDKSSEEHRLRTKYYTAVKRDAEASFDPPHRNDNGRPMLRDHLLPGPEEMVLRMNRAGSRPISDEAMQGTYGFLSNYVHPTPYSIREIFAPRERDGEMVPELQRDLDFHDRLARLVVVPFYYALGYATTYCGWAPGHYTRLTDDIDRLLPGVFVDGPPPPSFPQN